MEKIKLKNKIGSHFIKIGLFFVIFFATHSNSVYAQRCFPYQQITTMQEGDNVKFNDVIQFAYCADLDQGQPRYLSAMVSRSINGKSVAVDESLSYLPPGTHHIYLNYIVYYDTDVNCSDWNYSHNTSVMEYNSGGGSCTILELLPGNETASFTLVVTALPKAGKPGFITTTKSFCEDATVQLRPDQNRKSGDTYNYYSDAALTNKVGSATYNNYFRPSLNPGTTTNYWVTRTRTENSESEPIKITVKVGYKVLEANKSASSAGNCAGEIFTISATGNGHPNTTKYNYQWKQNGTVVSSSSSFDRVLNQEAEFSLTISDKMGICPAVTSTHTLKVTPHQDPNTYSDETINLTCFDDLATISLDNTENGVKYTLMNGSNVLSTLNGDGGTLNFGNDFAVGNYTIIGERATCGAITVKNITVTLENEKPIVQPQHLVYDLTCEGETEEIKLSSTELGVSYILYDADGNALLQLQGNDGSIDFGAFEEGYYEVKAQRGSTCPEVLAETYTINWLNPLPAFSIVAGKEQISVCSGSGNVNLEDLINNHSLDDSDFTCEFVIDAANGQGSRLITTRPYRFRNVSTNAAVAGTHTVTYTETNNISGCTKSGTITIVVNPLPVINDFVLNGFSIESASGDLNLSNLLVNPGSNNEWVDEYTNRVYLSSGEYFFTNDNYFPAPAGDYTLKYKEYNGFGCESSKELSFSVTSTVITRDLLTSNYESRETGAANVVVQNLVSDWNNAINPQWKEESNNPAINRLFSNTSGLITFRNNAATIPGNYILVYSELVAGNTLRDTLEIAILPKTTSRIASNESNTVTHNGGDNYEVTLPDEIHNAVVDVVVFSLLSGKELYRGQESVDIEGKVDISEAVSQIKGLYAVHIYHNDTRTVFKGLK